MTAVQARPGQRTAWGMEAVIDLYGCDLGRLRDPGMWRGFVANLVTIIGATARGELRLERFGQGEMCDWWAVQRLATGSITGRGDETGQRCFCNVVSSREFDPVAAATVAAAYFGGTHTLQVLRRGAAPPAAEASR